MSSVARTSSPPCTSSPPPEDNSESAKHACTLRELQVMKNTLVQALGSKKSDFTVGHVLQRCVAMFGPLTHLVAEADRRADPDGDAEDEDIKAKQDCLYAGFLILIGIVPDLKKKMLDPDIEPEDLNVYLAELQNRASIFTSPSSAENINEHENEAPDSEPPAKKRRGPNKKCTKGNVTSLCHLDGQVTPRTIAYAAVMLHFNLTDASTWQEDYCGFSYEGLWNFIVDYFEGPADPTLKVAANKLLKWWTKCVFPNSAKGLQAKTTVANSRKLLLAQRQAHVEVEQRQ